MPNGYDPSSLMKAFNNPNSYLGINNNVGEAIMSVQTSPVSTHKLLATMGVHEGASLIANVMTKNLASDVVVNDVVNTLITGTSYTGLTMSEARALANQIALVHPEYRSTIVSALSMNNVANVLTNMKVTDGQVNHQIIEKVKSLNKIQEKIEENIQADISQFNDLEELKSSFEARAQDLSENLVKLEDQYNQLITEIPEEMAKPILEVTIAGGNIEEAINNQLAHGVTKVNIQAEQANLNNLLQEGNLPVEVVTIDEKLKELATVEEKIAVTQVKLQSAQDIVKRIELASSNVSVQDFVESNKDLFVQFNYNEDMLKLQVKGYVGAHELAQPIIKELMQSDPSTWVATLKELATNGGEIGKFIATAAVAELKQFANIGEIIKLHVNANPSITNIVDFLKEHPDSYLHFVFRDAAKALGMTYTMNNIEEIVSHIMKANEVIQNTPGLLQAADKVGDVKAFGLDEAMFANYQMAVYKTKNLDDAAKVAMQYIAAEIKKEMFLSFRDAVKVAFAPAGQFTKDLTKDLLNTLLSSGRGFVRSTVSSLMSSSVDQAILYFNGTEIGKVVMKQILPKTIELAEKALSHSAMIAMSTGSVMVVGGIFAPFAISTVAYATIGVGIAERNLLLQASQRFGKVISSTTVGKPIANFIKSGGKLVVKLEKAGNITIKFTGKALYSAEGLSINAIEIGSGIVNKLAINPLKKLIKSTLSPIEKTKLGRSLLKGGQVLLKGGVKGAGAVITSTPIGYAGSRLGKGVLKLYKNRRLTHKLGKTGAVSKLKKIKLIKGIALLKYTGAAVTDIRRFIAKSEAYLDNPVEAALKDIMMLSAKTVTQLVKKFIKKGIKKVIGQLLILLANFLMSLWAALGIWLVIGALIAFLVAILFTWMPYFTAEPALTQIQLDNILISHLAGPYYSSGITKMGALLFYYDKMTAALGDEIVGHAQTNNEIWVKTNKDWKWKYGYIYSDYFKETDENPGYVDNIARELVNMMWLSYAPQDKINKSPTCVIRKMVTGGDVNSCPDSGFNGDIYATFITLFNEAATSTNSSIALQYYKNMWGSANGLVSYDITSFNDGGLEDFYHALTETGTGYSGVSLNSENVKNLLNDSIDPQIAWKFEKWNDTSVGKTTYHVSGRLVSDLDINWKYNVQDLNLPHQITIQGAEYYCADIVDKQALRFVTSPKKASVGLLCVHQEGTYINVKYGLYKFPPGAQDYNPDPSDTNNLIFFNVIFIPSIGDGSSLTQPLLAKYNANDIANLVKSIRTVQVFRDQLIPSLASFYAHFKKDRTITNFSDKTPGKYVYANINGKNYVLNPLTIADTYVKILGDALTPTDSKVQLDDYLKNMNETDYQIVNKDSIFTDVFKKVIAARNGDASAKDDIENDKAKGGMSPYVFNISSPGYILANNYSSGAGSSTFLQSLLLWNFYKFYKDKEELNQMQSAIDYSYYSPYSGPIAVDISASPMSSWFPPEADGQGLLDVVNKWLKEQIMKNTSENNNLAIVMIKGMNSLFKMIDDLIETLNDMAVSLLPNWMLPKGMVKESILRDSLPLQPILNYSNVMLMFSSYGKVLGADQLTVGAEDMSKILLDGPYWLGMLPISPAYMRYTYDKLVGASKEEKLAYKILSPNGGFDKNNTSEYKDEKVKAYLYTAYWTNYLKNKLIPRNLFYDPTPHVLYPYDLAIGYIFFRNGEVYKEFGEEKLKVSHALISDKKFMPMGWEGIGYLYSKILGYDISSQIPKGLQVWYRSPDVDPIAINSKSWDSHYASPTNRLAWGTDKPSDNLLIEDIDDLDSDKENYWKTLKAADKTALQLAYQVYNTGHYAPLWVNDADYDVGTLTDNGFTPNVKLKQMLTMLPYKGRLLTFYKLTSMTEYYSDCDEWGCLFITWTYDYGENAKIFVPTLSFDFEVDGGVLTHKNVDLRCYFIGEGNYEYLIHKVDLNPSYSNGYQLTYPLKSSPNDFYLPKEGKSKFLKCIDGSISYKERTRTVRITNVKQVTTYCPANGFCSTSYADLPDSSFEMEDPRVQIEIAEKLHVMGASAMAYKIGNLFTYPSGIKVTIPRPDQMWTITRKYMPVLSQTQRFIIDSVLMADSLALLHWQQTDPYAWISANIMDHLYKGKRWDFMFASGSGDLSNQYGLKDAKIRMLKHNTIWSWFTGWLSWLSPFQSSEKRAIVKNESILFPIADYLDANSNKEFKMQKTIAYHFLYNKIFNAFKVEGYGYVKEFGFYTYNIEHIPTILGIGWTGLLKSSNDGSRILDLLGYQEKLKLDRSYLFNTAFLAYLSPYRSLTQGVHSGLPRINITVLKDNDFTYLFGNGVRNINDNEEANQIVEKVSARVLSPGYLGTTDGFTPLWVWPEETYMKKIGYAHLYLEIPISIVFSRKGDIESANELTDKVFYQWEEQFNQQDKKTKEYTKRRQIISKILGGYSDIPKWVLEDAELATYQYDSVNDFSDQGRDTNSDYKIYVLVLKLPAVLAVPRYYFNDTTGSLDPSLNHKNIYMLLASQKDISDAIISENLPLMEGSTKLGILFNRYIESTPDFNDGGNAERFLSHYLNTVKTYPSDIVGIIVNHPEYLLSHYDEMKPKWANMKLSEEREACAKASASSKIYVCRWYYDDLAKYFDQVRQTVANYGYDIAFDNFNALLAAIQSDLRTDGNMYVYPDPRNIIPDMMIGNNPQETTSITMEAFALFDKWITGENAYEYEARNLQQDTEVLQHIIGGNWWDYLFKAKTLKSLFSPYIGHASFIVKLDPNSNTTYVGTPIKNILSNAFKEGDGLLYTYLQTGPQYVSDDSFWGQIYYQRAYKYYSQFTGKPAKMHSFLAPFQGEGCPKTSSTSIISQCKFDILAKHTTLNGAIKDYGIPLSSKITDKHWYYQAKDIKIEDWFLSYHWTTFDRYNPPTGLIYGYYAWIKPEAIKNNVKSIVTPYNWRDYASNVSIYGFELYNDQNGLKGIFPTDYRLVAGYLWKRGYPSAMGFEILRKAIDYQRDK